MNVKPKRNVGFVLLALLVLASAFAFIFFGEELQRLAGQSDGALIFPRLRPAEVTRVVIEARGQRAVLEHGRVAPPDGGAAETHDSVVRGDWYITAPRRIPADEGAISALLLRLSVLAPLRELPNADQEALGLAPARIRIELTDRQGQTRTLALGVEDAATGGLAARATRTRGGSSTFVVPADLAAAIAAPGLSYREARLTSLPVREATALRIDRGRERVSLVRAAEGEWAVDGVAPADGAEVQALLEEIATLHAERFVVEGEGPHDLAALGLENPEARLRIDVGDTVLRLALWRRGERVIAANLAGGPVVEVPSLWMKRLERPALAWRSTRALRFDASRAAVIRWSRRGELVLLTRGGDGRWSVLAPKPGDAREDSVRRLLDGMASLRMEGPRAQPAALARYGLAPPALEIAIDDAAGQRLDSIQLGHVLGKKRWARSPQWSTIFLVDVASLAALQTDPAELALPAAP